MGGTGRRLTPLERVQLEYFIRKGAADAFILASLTISRQTLYTYKRRLRITGSMAPRPQGFNRTKLMPWMLEETLEYLEYKPFLTLDEVVCYIADNYEIEITNTALSYRLRQAGWRNKKLKTIERKRDEFLRTAYLFSVSSFKPDWFVFCDESGLDRKDCQRRTGWAPKGYIPWVQGTLQRGKRWHVLPALALDGILHAHVYQGSTTKEGFLAWLSECVIPCMNPFPGPKSVLVMDNASWHHGQEIRDVITASGIQAIYLPPYSPDFNPIEAYFADLKAHIRKSAVYRRDAFADDLSFGRFLEEAIELVGKRTDAIRGHFQHAMVPGL